MSVCDRGEKPISKGESPCDKCAEKNMETVDETEKKADFELAQKSEKPEKKSEIFVKIKRFIINNGKDSVLEFLIKKVLFCLLSAVLSAAIVFFTQNSFKEDFSHYYNNTCVPLFEEVNELALDIDRLRGYKVANLLNLMVRSEGMQTDEAAPENALKERAKSIHRKAAAYSSSDKEIAKLHDRVMDVCDELQNLTSVAYCSISMGKEYSVEYYAALQNLNSKIEMFEELRDELCEKHGIEMENGEIK